MAEVKFLIQDDYSQLIPDFYEANLDLYGYYDTNDDGLKFQNLVTPTSDWQQQQALNWIT